MDKEPTLGEMEGSMMEITIWIKSMDLEFTSGLTAGSMKGSGPMGDSMEKADTHLLILKLEEEYGEKARELNGQMNSLLNNLKE